MTLQKRFTQSSVELLVVIAITGLLNATAIPSIFDRICESKTTRSKASQQTMQTQLFIGLWIILKASSVAIPDVTSPRTVSR